MHVDLGCFELNKFSLKRKKCLKFYRFLNLLFGDISFNLSSSQYLQGNDNEFEPFHKRGLRFLHIDVHGPLLKIYELRNIVCHTKPTILGINESKLDSSVSDQETCYVRTNLCFNSSNIFSN